MKFKIFLSSILTFSFLASPISVFAASLSLSPATGTFNKNCAFTLQINLNTGTAQTDGTDAIILYDQSKFSAQSISSGSIYSDYPGNSVDDNAGKVTVSGLASVNSPYTGTGTLATISFKVKENAQPGVSQVKFDFDPNDKSKTTDSNVVERGTVADILSSVTNGSYTVGTGACSSQTGVQQGAPGVGTPSATIAPTPTPRTLDDLTNGPPGTSGITFAVAIVGSILAIFGILGLVLL